MSRWIMAKNTYRVNKENFSSKLSVKRRMSTRTSGFKSHPDTTGGEVKYESVVTYELKRGHFLKMIFSFDNITFQPNYFIGFGGWIYYQGNIDLSYNCAPYIRHRAENTISGDWHAIGAIYKIKNETQIEHFELLIKANSDSVLAFWGFDCGTIHHKYITDTLHNKPSLLDNLYAISPEANFIKDKGNILYKSNYSRNNFVEYIDLPEINIDNVSIQLKSCNRCARYLPINYPNERHTLSFSNHCVSRAPCNHPGFGKLRIIDKNTKEESYLNLHFGFQLECRFCKKFEVNAPHNPQRTVDQMKEDGIRRRNFEQLLSELFGENPQIQYRANTGRELATDIWEKFNKKCFKCKKYLSSPQDMHLDHTRPLALLWPLDDTATCLCADCNSQKSDKFPSEFYNDEELNQLSKITNVSLEDLRNNVPNMIAVEKIISNIDKVIYDFCTKPALLRESSGKIPAELLLKSLQRVLDMTKYKGQYDLITIFNNRTTESNI